MLVDKELKDCIKNSLGKLFLENDYKIIDKGENIIYYAKRYSEDLALYIRCPYSGFPGAGYKLSLFFSTVNGCDDMNKIGIGIEFSVGNIEKKVESNIKYGRKLLLLESQIGCFEKMILDEMHSSSYKTEWFDYYMKYDYLYYNCLKNCEEIKEEWEKLHKDVIKDIQNNAAKSVDKICSDFLDDFDKCLYEKNSINFDEKCFKQDFSRQVYAQCVLDA